MFSMLPSDMSSADSSSDTFFTEGDMCGGIGDSKPTVRIIAGLSPMSSVCFWLFSTSSSLASSASGLASSAVLWAAPPSRASVSSSISSITSSITSSMYSSTTSSSASSCSCCSLVNSGHSLGALGHSAHSSCSDSMRLRIVSKLGRNSGLSAQHSHSSV